MNSTPISTGDPTIDGIINWVTGGGDLQSTGAILGLGSVVKLIMIPLLSRLCAKLNINFSGPNKLHGVLGCGCLLVVVISLATHQRLTLGDTVMLGVQAGLAAIGLHEAASTLSDASKAQAAAQDVAA